MPIREAEPPNALLAAIGAIGSLAPTADVVVMKTRQSAVVVVMCEAEQHEDRRRAEIGLRGVDHGGTLDVLASLPIGLPIPIDELGRRERNVIGRAPAGVVATADGAVTRLLERPVRIIGIGASASSWLSGMAALRPMLGFGPRLLLLPEHEVDDPTVRIQADRYGVGLATPTGLALAPRPFMQARFTTIEWRFKERVYSTLRPER